MSITPQKQILVSPLNWGLGHATRCIPIIKALINHNFEPILASDGNALKLLEKEFPLLKTLELPSYNITYSKKANGFKLKLLKDTPYLLKVIKREKKMVAEFIKNKKITGIISDNRLGVHHPEIASVFITHQLRVLSGTTTWISSKLHQNIISKFDQCWVPDYEGSVNLSGNLGHAKHNGQTVKYMGPMSRFEKMNLKSAYKLMVLLSGPEPQRTYLEEKLLSELQHFNGKVLFVKGLIEPQQIKETVGHFDIYNFMTSPELEIAINSSDLILCRSGYTTIMDLAKLEKKAFFIPTPGQYEQDYLAKKFEVEGIAPYAKQNSFKLDHLVKAKDYTGFSHETVSINYDDLFSFF